MLSLLSNSVLSNYFLEPAGFLALSALIPLIIFYLVKPKPDEKMMPSIRFFMQDRKEGKVKQAISKILQNLMLIFHILFVATVAAAIANPYIQAPATAENSVTVIDNSASMQKHLQESKNFAVENLGEQNTVIVVNDDVNVALREAGKGEARRHIQDLEIEETGTDLASAVQRARNFEGQIVLATDRDHSSDSRDADSMIEDISTTRDVKTMEISSDNSWGIVGLNARQEWVEVKNYEGSAQKVPVELDGTAEEVEIGSEEVKEVKLDLEPGRNTVKLPEDGMTADNNAYFYIPRSNRFDTAVISESKNRYLYKAFELINSTSTEYYSTPVDDFPEADVYVLGGSESLLSQTVNQVEKRVEDEGATAVVFADEGLEEDHFDSLPVQDIGGEKSQSVEFNKPRKVNVGNTEVFDADLKGNSLSDPREALVHRGYGEGDVIFYNIDDSDFRTDFLYPVFWKNLVQEYSEVETAETLNVQTGQVVGGSNSAERIQETGFHNISGNTYAANLINEEESSPAQEYAATQSKGQNTAPRSIQNLSALAVLVLALIEFGYLKYIGDIEW